MQSQPRAVIYVRVSTEEQVQTGTSLEDQRERCLQFAEFRNVLPVQVIEDAGVSGARYETRPGLMKALQAVERGEAEILLVTKIDRLGRKSKIVLEVAERVDQAGGQIVTCDGTEYGKTAAGKLMLAQFASFAEFERDAIRERSLSGKQSRARQGIQTQRARSPYGYHIVTGKDVMEGQYTLEQVGRYIVIEDQAQWVRFIFEQYDRGTSLNKIARELERRGVLPPCAARNENRQVRKWWATTVRAILENSVYKGQATFGRMETVSGENLMNKNDPTKRLKAGKRYRQRASWQTITVSPLIDADVWERCNVRLQQNIDEKKALLGGNPGRKYMLSGLTRCPKCGRKMSGTYKKGTKGQKVSYYCCRSYLENPCKPEKYHHLARPLESLTLLSIAYIIEHPEAIADAVRAFDEYQEQALDEKEVVAERERLKGDLDRLNNELASIKKAMLAALRAGLREDDFITELETFARRRTVIEGRLKELERQTSPGEDEKPETVAEKLQALAQAIITVFFAEEEDFSPAEKQELLARIIQEIIPTPEGAIVRFKLASIQTVETLQLVDMHCVTRWSRLGNVWEGVSTREIVKHVKIKPEAKFVLVSAYDKGFSFRGGSVNWDTNLPLEYFLDEDCLFADTHDGEPISLEHGGPLRLVIPKLYAWKSAKWVKGIEFLAEDSAGFWERGGYHMLGDPWKEQRYRYADAEEEDEE